MVNHTIATADVNVTSSLIYISGFRVTKKKSVVVTIKKRGDDEEPRFLII